MDPGPDAAAQKQQRHRRRKQLSGQAVQQRLTGGHRGDRGPCGRKPGQDRGQALALRLLRRLQSAQQRHQEGDRAEAVELDALLFQLPDRLLHLFPALEELGLHGARRQLQQLADLLHAELLVVAHTDDQLLLLRQLGHDLPHQPGRLLPIQGQLRLVLHLEIGKLRLLLVLLVRRQLREAQRQALGHAAGGLVDHDPPQPIQKGLVRLQLIQTLKGPEIAVLEDVPGQVVVPDHGADRAIEDDVGLLIELAEGGLIPGLSLGHQLRGDLSSLFLLFIFLFHG